jgi:hypothetical protein
MEPFDLINAIHPPGGCFALCGIDASGRVKHHWVEAAADMQEQLEKWLPDHDLYFSMSNFEGPGKRTKDRVSSVKAFWLDLDCGPEKGAVPASGTPKGYLTKRLAAEALEKFRAELDLPTPTLVDTGGGIHVYWVLEEAVSREQWEETAAKFKALCVAHKLYVDPAVFEVSRIMRLPGTFNYKKDEPRPTVLKAVGPTTTYEAFCALLGTKPAQPEPVVKTKRQSALSATFDEADSKGFPPFSFAKIAAQCKQLQKCIDNAAELEEPMWRAALSIATLCVDREEALSAVSAAHKDYDPARTERKATETKGAYSCKVIEGLNPTGCDGCQFKGKSGTPMRLGLVVVEAKEEVPQGDAGAPAEKGAPLPHSYVRGDDGALWRRQGDELPDVKVCETMLYVIKRMYDPEKGYVTVFRLVTPLDGTREFFLPNRVIVEKAELRKGLAAEGIMGSDKQSIELAMYINICINNLQKRKKADNMRTQFGWADDDTKFIIGDREYGPHGVSISIPSAATEQHAERMTIKGTLDDWREVFDLYAAPGLEPHAFGALTAFGAPLFKFSGQSGVIINVVHPKSGTGKTTILHMCNSVYGMPKEMCGSKEDTANARISRLGAYKNLPFTVDEMTNMEPKDFSAQAYAMGSGKGKDRMRQHSNSLRRNDTTWQTISLCSSNASFREKLLSLKASPDGELMRLFEYSIDYTSALEPEYAREMFDHQLLENHGHAGGIYAEWLVNNHDEAKRIWSEVEAKLIAKIGLIPKERFRTGGVVSNLAGGVIAKRLGLCSYDLKAIFNWAVAELLRMREDAAAIAGNASSSSVVGDFINLNTQNILVVNAKKDKQSGMQSMPKQEPKGELRVRFEPDTSRVFIVSKTFMDYCTSKQLPYRDLIAEMKSTGLLLNSGAKRMSAGMKLSGPPVYAMELDFQHAAFEGAEPLIEAMGGQEGEEDDGGPALAETV